jgi:hypothetical protein
VPQVVGSEAVDTDENDKRLCCQAGHPGKKNEYGKKTFAHVASFGSHDSKTMTTTGVIDLVHDRAGAVP